MYERRVVTKRAAPSRKKRMRSDLSEAGNLDQRATCHSVATR